MHLLELHVVPLLNHQPRSSAYSGTHFSSWDISSNNGFNSLIKECKMLLIIAVAVY